MIGLRTIYCPQEPPLGEREVIHGCVVREPYQPEWVIERLPAKRERPRGKRERRDGRLRKRRR